MPPTSHFPSFACMHIPSLVEHHHSPQDSKPLPSEPHESSFYYNIIRPHKTPSSAKQAPQDRNYCKADLMGRFSSVLTCSHLGCCSCFSLQLLLLQLVPASHNSQAPLGAVTPVAVMPRLLSALLHLQLLPNTHLETSLFLLPLIAAVTACLLCLLLIATTALAAAAPPAGPNCIESGPSPPHYSSRSNAAAVTTCLLFSS